MSSDQLQKATHEIYAPIKSSGENPWTVFRDAVATAGTGPALVTIKDWISSRKIYGEEAAEIVAQLSRSARTPTPEYLSAFFSLATKSEVTKQAFLNTTAILSFTNLVRKAQVDNETAHNYYGVHAFGRLSPINSKNITEKYIPYLARALHSAVKDGDSHSIQVYIRALGNIAHPKILSVFEPYLEGKEQMSTFQRTLMVTALNKLGWTYPKVARRVLFNVYQNIAEAHEVRCAAVLALMRTAPPAFMLQRMAEFTNNDVSAHVSSIVKSAIQTAANLDGYHHQQMRKNAKAAVNLLTPKEFGLHYSKEYLKSYLVKEMGLAYQSEFSWIGSSDSIIPSSLYLSVKKIMGGFKAPSMALGIMTSSIDDIADLVSDQFEDSTPSGRSAHHKRGRQSSSSHSLYSTDTIAEMLDIQPSESNQIEGNILLRSMDSERFFTFDNHTIESLPHMLKSAASKLREGQRFNYNKLYNQYSLTLSFPTETGVPFVYTLKRPTYISIRGEIKAKTHPDIASGSHSSIRIPDALNVTGNFQVVYSSRIASKISFVAPITHQRYIAGLDRNIQFNLPLRANFSIDTVNTRVNLTLKPLYPNRDSLLFHYSTWPYTAKHNVLDLNPVFQGSDHKVIHVREPHSYDYTFGKNSTGFAFRVKYLTEQKYLDAKWLYDKAQRHDVISYLLYPYAEKTIKNNNINLYLDAHKSSSRAVTFTVDYSNDTKVEDNYSSNESQSGSSEANESKYDHSSASGPSAKSSTASPSTTAPISEKRQKEFLSKAASGIRNSSTSVLDMAVVFTGEKYITYVATAAYADSEVDEKSRVLLYFHRSPKLYTSKPFEVCLAYEGKYPNVPIMNYAKALKAKPTSYVTMDIAFGESCRSSQSQISIKAKAEQTQERKEYLRHSPLSQLCMSQMQRGEYLQPACRNVTNAANLLDSYSIDIRYEKLSPAFKNYTYKVYDMIKYMAYPYVDENVIGVHNKEGRVSIDVDFDEDLWAANVSLSAPYLEAEFNRVRVNKTIQTLVVQHPSYSATDRFLSNLLSKQYTAMCSLDRTAVNTFDNKTYPVNLGKCWHVMMITQPEESYSSSYSDSSDSSNRNITVLARDVSDRKKEIKVLLGDQVFDIKPTSSGSTGSSENSDADATVYYNEKQQHVSQHRINDIEDDEGEILAQWWTLPSGALIFEAPQHNVKIMYNGYGARLQAGSYHRDNVIGLCGTYDGETSTDFTTPKNCIVSQPEVFAASYAIPDQTCQGPAKDMHRRAASAPCYRKTATPYEAINEEDYNAGHQSNYNRKSNNSKNKPSSYSCTHQRTKIFDEGSRICFSTRPLPACTEKCRPTGMTEHSVPVHCVAKSDATSHYVQMVKKGANPDFSRKQVSKTVKIEAPKGCAPH